MINYLQYPKYIPLDSSVKYAPYWEAIYDLSPHTKKIHYPGLLSGYQMDYS